MFLWLLPNTLSDSKKKQVALYSDELRLAVMSYVRLDDGLLFEKSEDVASSLKE